MEGNLKKLLDEHIISRKQYRELRAMRLRTPEEVLDALKAQAIIDPVEKKEVEALIRGTGPLAFPESKSPLLRALFSEARQVASSDTTVLLLGESGVGKSRLARFIHEHSGRRTHPFVTVSCGSIPETLLESELFGAEKGAYTGAVRDREGKFKTADPGTLFLDEIGDVPLSVQVKLLRAIQERRIEPLGSDREVEINVRLIAATNRDLDSAVRTGHFRQDLYYRLNVVPFTLPPLRERAMDLPDLIEYFLAQQTKKQSRPFELPGALKEHLLTWKWPGNIRELENCIERLCVLCPDHLLRFEHLPPAIQSAPALAPSSSGAQGTLQEAEAELLRQALKKTDGNISGAARLLGIHRNSLARKMRRMGLSLRQFRNREG
ncbi:MAG: sigma-54-dependent Fis family transcriptional regulator [Spirochaetales bacterium]|nr:sigma-54-dependent Fis family transcriptional regulator [Spirochaetales bacterium]